MSKYLFALLIACLLPYRGFGQRIIVQEGKLNGILPVNESDQVSYQLLQVVDGVTKEELFKRGRQWFNKMYNSSKDVIRISDPSTGRLSCVDILLIPESVMGITRDYPIRYLLAFHVKDGKYRIIISDFVFIGDNGDTYPLEKLPFMGRDWCDRFYTKVNQKVSPLIESLQKALTTADDF